MPKCCFLDLLESPMKAACISQWAEQGLPIIKKKFLNITAFIIATLNSHGELKLTPFLLLF